MASEKTPNVPALERGMGILELVAKSKNGFTFSQLTRQLSYPKSSIHCLLVTFERLGYLERIPTSGRYVAGLNLVRIANVASHGILLRQKAGPILCELTRRTGLTAHMAVLENNEAVLIAKVEPSGKASSKRSRSRSVVISRLPPAAFTSAAKATRERSLVLLRNSDVVRMPPMIGEIAGGQSSMASGWAPCSRL